MVILKTNDRVIVYDLIESEFEKYVNNNDLNGLEKYKKYEMSKIAYSPEKMKTQLGERFLEINSYYDNESGMLKKININDITEIEFSEKKEENHEVEVNLEQVELIALDNELNSCEHISNLLPPHIIIEFKKLYDSENYRQHRGDSLEHINQSYVLDSFYEIETFSKLIMRKNNRRMTSSSLEGNVFLTVAPAGINVQGEKTYFIEEYKITKQDISEINKIFRRFLKDDNIKADSLTEEEKYLYFDRAVREYKQNLMGELQRVNSKSRSIVSGNIKTWTAYKAEFLQKYGYPVEEFTDKWAFFEKNIIDARTIHNGRIVPITIEVYQRESSNKIVNNSATKDIVSKTDSSDRKKFFDENIHHIIDNIENDLAPSVEGELTDEKVLSNIDSTPEDESKLDVPEVVDLTDESIFNNPDIEEDLEEEDELDTPEVEENLTDESIYNNYDIEEDLEEEDEIATPEVEEDLTDESIFSNPDIAEDLEEEDELATPEVEEDLTDESIYSNYDIEEDLEEEDELDTPEVEEDLTDESIFSNPDIAEDLEDEDENELDTPDEEENIMDKYKFSLGLFEKTANIDDKEVDSLLLKIDNKFEQIEQKLERILFLFDSKISSELFVVNSNYDEAFAKGSYQIFKSANELYTIVENLKEDFNKKQKHRIFYYQFLSFLESLEAFLSRCNELYDQTNQIVTDIENKEFYKDTSKVEENLTDESVFDNPDIEKESEDETGLDFLEINDKDTDSLLLKIDNKFEQLEQKLERIRFLFDFKISSELFVINSGYDETFVNYAHQVLDLSNQLYTTIEKIKKDFYINKINQNCKLFFNKVLTFLKSLEQFLIMCNELYDQTNQIVTDIESKKFYKGTTSVSSENYANNPKK